MRENFSKYFSFCIAWVLSVGAFAQFDFKGGQLQESIFLEPIGDSIQAHPDYDSIQFELRFWTFHGYSGLLVLSYRQDQHWSASKGLMGKGKMNMSAEELPSGFDALWSRLDSLGILSLPHQDSLTYRYNDGTRVRSVRPPRVAGHTFIKRHPEDPTYVVELFASHKYRYYSYHNPVELGKDFGPGEWESPETVQFAAIVQLLVKTFDLEAMRRAIEDPYDDKN